MAEANAQATPAIDYEKLGAAIAASLAPTLSEAQKPLLERLEKLQAPAAPATAPAAATQPANPAQPADKPLTAADVQKLMSDALVARDASAAVASARAAYIADKMKGVPAAYLAQIPNTGDVAQLAAAEQRVREQYAADLKAAGITAPATAPAAGGAPATRAPLDYSKMTGSQLITEGLKDRQTVLSPGDPAAAAAMAAKAPPAAAK